MSVAADTLPVPGEIVRVRSRRYLVEAVEPPERATGDQSLVRLSCLEDDAEGEPLEVLWERGIDARRMNDADWSKLAQGVFDPPRWFAAYYRTLRWNAVCPLIRDCFRRRTARASALTPISSSRCVRRSFCRASTSSSPTMWASARRSKRVSSSVSC